MIGLAFQEKILFENMTRVDGELGGGGWGGVGGRGGGGARNFGPPIFMKLSQNACFYEI